MIWLLLNWQRMVVALTRPGLTVVEAGTGTGKTVAYMLSAIPLARANGKTLVIATGTVALQEQLISRDMPALLAATGWDLSIALAKGRSRYLCPMRLEQCLDAMGSQDQGLFLFEDEISFNPSEENRQFVSGYGRCLGR